MTDDKDFVHFGLAKIAERLHLSKDTTRKLLLNKDIRAYRAAKGTWYCIESEINEDIRTLPGKL